MMPSVLNQEKYKQVYNLKININSSVYINNKLG